MTRIVAVTDTDVQDTNSFWHMLEKHPVNGNAISGELEGPYSPAHIAKSDVVEALSPRPSCYYVSRSKVKQYLNSYLDHCKHQPHHRLQAVELLRLYDKEYDQARRDGERVLDALWKVKFDEMQADCQAVKEAQGESSDWRWA